MSSSVYQYEPNKPFIKALIVCTRRRSLWTAAILNSHDGDVWITSALGLDVLGVSCGTEESVL